MELTDVLCFIIELLSKAIVLVLKLVYLALEVEDFVVCSLVVLFMIASILFGHH